MALLAVGGLTAGLVLGPWVGYNLSRFQKPTFVSNEAGVTLASADCDRTFSGYFEGYWSMECAADAPIAYHGDESVANAAYEKYALTYLRHHESRLLPVTLAKIGRAFAFFRPMQQMSFDSQIETRPYTWALIGLFGYYVLLVLSIPGSIILRRRGVPIFPLWAVGVNVVIAVAVAFGNTRYRIPFEVSLILMSAVVVDWLWARFTADRGEEEESRGIDDAFPETDQPLAHPTHIAT